MPSRREDQRKSGPWQKNTGTTSWLSIKWAERYSTKHSIVMLARCNKCNALDQFSTRIGIAAAATSSSYCSRGVSELQQCQGHGGRPLHFLELAGEHRL